MSNIFSEINSTDLYSLSTSIENNSDIAFTIANEISEKCTSSLDSYVRFISEQLRNTKSISNDQLDQFILNLPIYIYYASSMVESLGIKEDVSSLVKKNRVLESLNEIKSTNVSGTAAMKLSMAESICTNDILVNSIFSTAYKIAKSKVDFAYEILASCKKVMSRRIEELKAFTSDTKRDQSKFSN